MIGDLTQPKETNKPLGANGAYVGDGKCVGISQGKGQEGGNIWVRDTNLGVSPYISNGSQGSG